MGSARGKLTKSRAPPSHPSALLFIFVIFVISLALLTLLLKHMWALDSLIADDDVPFEQLLLKEPHNPVTWLEYYGSCESHSIYKRVFILSRAVTVLAQNTEIWSIYLELRVKAVKALAWNHPDRQKALLAVNLLFQRALLHTSPTPHLWVLYLEFLLATQVSSVTYVRLQFNRALGALSVEQHTEIWPLYLRFAAVVQGPPAVRIYLNFLKYVAPEDVAEATSVYNVSIDEIITSMIQCGGITEGMAVFRQLVASPDHLARLAISPLQLWTDVLDTVSGTRVEPKLYDEFVQQGLEQFPDQISRFYTTQARFYESRNDHSRARDTLQRGLDACRTVRDFVHVFDRFAEYEERVIELLLEQGEESAVELRMSFLEALLDNRAVYLNNMMIKQDPNNLDEWFHRIAIYEAQGDITKVLSTFAAALTTINPLKCHSLTSNPKYTLPRLWMKYADVYSSNGDVKTASVVFSKAVQSQFKSPDDLVELYVAWSLLELQSGDAKLAIKLIEDACLYVPSKGDKPAPKHISYSDGAVDIHVRLHKSLKLWNYYLELLESSVDEGSADEVSAVCKAYDTAINLKIATPANILNYAEFLESCNCLDRALGVYELGIKLFRFPVAFEIWNVYLAKTIEIQKKNTENIRDLFDQCLQECPANISKPILVLYSTFEEKNGLLLKSIKILRQGAARMQYSTDPKVMTDKCDLYTIVLFKLSGLKVVGDIREMYETIVADDNITPFRLVEFAMQFIDFEIAQKEYVRCRQLFKYLVELNPPSEASSIWEKWENFELDRGNENSFKDMLRVKRVVNEKYANTNAVLTGFVKSSQPAIKRMKPNPKQEGTEESKEAVVENPEEIDLDMD